MAQANPGGTYSNNTIEDRVKTASSQFGDKASDMASKAGEKIESAMQSAEDTARSMAQHGREAGERVNEVAGNFRTAVDKSVRDQPMATLAVAAALGFVVGALWKS